MKCAVVVFVYNGKESKEYYYKIEEHLEKALSPDEFVIVESAKNIYGIGVFKRVDNVVDKQTLDIVTKEVVQDTGLYYTPEDEEQAITDLF